MGFGGRGGCVVPAQRHPASRPPHRGEHRPKQSESGARGRGRQVPTPGGRASPSHVWTVFKADPCGKGDGRGGGEEFGRHRSSPRATGGKEPQCVLAKTVGTSAVTMATLLKKGNYRASLAFLQPGSVLVPKSSCLLPLSPWPVWRRVTCRVFGTIRSPEPRQGGEIVIVG